LHRGVRRPGVADGGRRHRQRRDPSGARYPSALRRRRQRGTRLMATITTHTLSVLVADKPGVLARVASLFSRRGFNIESLAVGATETKGLSRMTIVVSVEDTPLEQITKQLNKLINVIKIVEQDEQQSVSRELALIKIRADAATRGQVVEAVNLFRAK